MPGEWADWCDMRETSEERQRRKAYEDGVEEGMKRERSKQQKSLKPTKD